MKSIALAAMIAGAVLFEYPAQAGEAEDVARARAIIAAFKAAKEASSRASRRAIAALGVVYNCEGCALSTIVETAENNHRTVRDTFELLQEEFYKEEIAR